MAPNWECRTWASATLVLAFRSEMDQIRMSRRESCSFGVFPPLSPHETKVTLKVLTRWILDEPPKGK